MQELVSGLGSPGAVRSARLVAVAGVALGVLAGVVQLLLGPAIPQWTGNKIDTAGLGLVTIILSLVAGAGLWRLRLARRRMERLAYCALVIACAAVCFTTVGRLWYLPGPLLMAAAVLALAGEASAVDERRAAGAAAAVTVVPSGAGADAEGVPRLAGGVGGWLLFASAAVGGVALSLLSLPTLLLGRGWPSVAVAAAVALVAGAALSAAIAPGLRRRTPALLAAGLGAGLMAGGLALAVTAVMIAAS